MITNDPHDIEERFVRHHQDYFIRAMKEVRDGRKDSCWSWFLLPTAPYVVDGVERGSSMNRAHALRGDAAAVAYLTFATETTLKYTSSNKPISLRDNYLDIVGALRDQLRHSNLTLNDIMGAMDGVKAISSFRLFERIGKKMRDKELYHLCRDVLELCGEGPSSGETKRFRKLTKKLFSGGKGNVLGSTK